MHRTVEDATYISLVSDTHTHLRSPIWPFCAGTGEGWSEWQKQKHCSPDSHLSSWSSLWSDNCAEEDGEEKEEKIDVKG